MPQFPPRTLHNFYEAISSLSMEVTGQRTFSLCPITLGASAIQRVPSSGSSSYGVGIGCPVIAQLNYTQALPQKQSQ